jgi:5-(carboxyamino)imidazole ribonucleotide synthase
MSDQTIGIIGDGQLGMLLCEAAPALGLQTIMLTAAPDCAAARRADATVEGAMDDSVALAELIARCDVITYEREDVPPRAIAQLREAEASGDVDCYPPLSAIEIIQDKARQKRWLADSALGDAAICDQRWLTASHAHAASDPRISARTEGPARRLRRSRGTDPPGPIEALGKAWPGETLFENTPVTSGKSRCWLCAAAMARSAHFGPGRHDL